jgi:hypothetical protein
MGGDVIGEINYLSSTIDGCSPWTWTISIPMTLRSNLAQVFVPVTIHDFRGKEMSVNLDTNGLEVLEYNGNIQEEGVKHNTLITKRLAICSRNVWAHLV